MEKQKALVDNAIPLVASDGYGQLPESWNVRLRWGERIDSFGSC